MSPQHNRALKYKSVPLFFKAFHYVLSNEYSEQWLTFGSEWTSYALERQFFDLGMKLNRPK